MKLPLLPELAWKGFLTIIGHDGDNYIVQFNAKGVDSGKPVFIYDRTILTARQLEDWTGYRKDKKP